METLEVKAKQIVVVPGFNSRIFFDPETITELAQTIKEHGILSPLLVRPSKKKDVYELIAGERRYRAGLSIKLDKYPVIVREIDDKAAIELMAIENLQRDNLHPIEEASAIDKLIKAGLTNQQIADKIGMSQAFVSKRNTLNNLSPDWQKAFFDGYVNTSGAMAIAKVYQNDQSKIYKDLSDSFKKGNTIHVSNVNQCINKLSVTLDQTKVPFRLDDPTIYPKAGACSSCSKRSCAILEIWNQPDKEQAVCLDSECYSTKVNIVVKLAEEEAIKKLEEERAKQAAIEAKAAAKLAKATGKEKASETPVNEQPEEEKSKMVELPAPIKEIPAEATLELLKVSTDWTCSIPGVVAYENWNEVKKDTPAAIPAIVAHGHKDIGKFIYVVRSRGNNAGPMTEDQKAARKALIRDNKIANTTTRLCVSAIADNFYINFLETGGFEATVMDHILSDKIGFGQSQDFISYLSERYGFDDVDQSDYMGRRQAITDQISKLDGALKLKLLVDSFFLWTTINDNNGQVMGVANAMTSVDVDALRATATQLVDLKKGRGSAKEREEEKAFGLTNEAALEAELDKEVGEMEAAQQKEENQDPSVKHLVIS